MKKIVVFTLAACALTACHKNPLITTPKHQTVKAVFQASIAAEKKAGHFQSGQGYGKCVRGEQDVLDCDTLYRDMVEHLKKEKAFSSIQAEDIADENAFKPIEAAYDEFIFKFMMLGGL